jgi:predicted metal-binding protein
LEPRDERAGARLYAALNHAVSGEGGPKVTLVPVDCMSVCKRPVTVGFATPGKWTYVYGDFARDGLDAAADIILDGAKRFAAAPDGLIPWKERPEALKRGVIARLPPSAA